MGRGAGVTRAHDGEQPNLPTWESLKSLVYPHTPRPTGQGRRASQQAANRDRTERTAGDPSHAAAPQEQAVCDTFRHAAADPTSNERVRGAGRGCRKEGLREVKFGTGVLP
jgi:hypothetical protein